MSKLIYKNLENHRKNWPAVVGGIIVVVALAYGFYGTFFDVAVNGGYARLEIDLGGQRRAFEGEVLEDMTLLEALQAATFAGNLSFNYVMDGEENLKVKTIDGYNIELTGREPSFFLNSRQIDSKKIHVIPVRPGDNILVILD